MDRSLFRFRCGVDRSLDRERIGVDRSDFRRVRRAWIVSGSEWIGAWLRRVVSGSEWIGASLHRVVSGSEWNGAWLRRAWIVVRRCGWFRLARCVDRSSEGLTEQCVCERLVRVREGRKRFEVKITTEINFSRFWLIFRSN